MRLETAQAASAHHEQSTAEAEHRLQACRQAAAAAQQAAAESEAVVAEAMGELTDAEEASPTTLTMLPTICPSCARLEYVLLIC